MNDTLFLTWQYVKFNRGRLSVVVALVTLAALLPLALGLFAKEALQHFRGDDRSVPAAQSFGGVENDLAGVGNMLSTMVAGAAIASLIVILGVLALSVGTRRAELRTLSRLGCSSMRVGALLILECGLTCLISAFLTGLILLFLGNLSADLVPLLLLR